MSIANVPELGSDFVLNNMVNRQYTLVFAGSSLKGYGQSSIIPVKSRREVELFLLSMGEEAGVFMDDHARKLYPEVWEWLSGRTYVEVLAGIKWSGREEDEFIDLIKRIPLPVTLSDNLKIYRDDFQLERISREYVQKIHQNNVLISRPCRCGNMFYFNGLKNSSEFKIDHGSDHLEGIIIFEAVRQAGIASAHLSGVPFSSQIVLLKTAITYKKFIEYDEPYLIHVIPVIRHKRGYCYFVFNVIQTGNSCATGFLASFL